MLLFTNTLKYFVLQEMAMRKVTRTVLEEEEDDMVREIVLCVKMCIQTIKKCE